MFKKKNNIKSLFWIIILILILFFALGLIRNLRNNIVDGDKPEIEITKPNEDYVITKFELNETRIFFE